MSEPKYYSTVTQESDGFWYFVDPDGQKRGPYNTELDAVTEEHLEWEKRHRDHDTGNESM
jgi:hypothetical protein